MSWLNEILHASTFFLVLHALRCCSCVGSSKNDPHVMVQQKPSATVVLPMYMHADIVEYVRVAMHA